MSKPVVIKPAGRNLVRNPDTNRHLDKTGEPIILNSYWRRRIADGDVVEVKQADKEPK